VPKSTELLDIAMIHRETRVERDRVLESGELPNRVRGCRRDRASRHQSCSAYLSTKIEAAPTHIRGGSVQIPAKNFIVKRRQLHVIPSFQKQCDGSVLQIFRRIHHGIKAIFRIVSHFETLS
jgi:hypothetical protein